MRLALQVYDRPGGTLLEDWSNIASGVEVEKNEHGTAVIRAFVPMPQKSAFHWSKQHKLYHVELGTGAKVIGSARLEDPVMVDGGLSVAAYGYWRAFSDLLYTALWSTTDVTKWKVLNREVYDDANLAKEYFIYDTDSRLYVGLKKGETYGANSRGSHYWQPPDGSAKLPVRFMFSRKIQTTGTNTVHIYIRSYTDDFGSQTTEFSISGSSPILGAEYLSLTASRRILEFSAQTTIVISNNPNSSGAYFLRLRNVRVVTDATHEINTTIAASIAAGSGAVVTPADMTGIYVGQKLVIDDTANSEIVTVTALTDTTFTADFVNSYTGPGITVKAPLIYADTIIKALVAYINSANPTQLQSSTTLIESPGRDLTDVSYEDARPANIVNDLLDRGDNQSPPRLWEAGVTNDRRAYFRPKGGQAQTWQVSIDDLTFNPSTDGLFNEVYGTYQDENGRTLRTASASDADSISEHGVTRQDVVKVRTTSAAQAEVQRDAYLASTADVTPKASLTITQMYINREPAPLWECEPGDTVEIADMALDNQIIDSFTIKRLVYNVDNNVLQVTPEEELPEIEFLLAQGASV